MSEPPRIYHNPRCSKSRAALALLREQGIAPEIVEYLKTPPDRATLEDLIAKLGISPRQLLRTGEAAYRELGLADPELADERIIQAMVDHPKLIERPIVVRGGQARIGRPPERILEIV
ncbi:MAG: arsenate reductase (glutaredoxin) [Thioalkalivibrio sp.]|nr:MAG: arsenate reductase (glutaredoxin) [Thioalkalivibrio sp.]